MCVRVFARFGKDSGIVPNMPGTNLNNLGDCRESVGFGEASRTAEVSKLL